MPGHAGYRAASCLAARLQELWQLLISANETGTGIPQCFLDEKADELRKQKEEQERVQVRARLESGVGSRVHAGRAQVLCVCHRSCCPAQTKPPAVVLCGLVTALGVHSCSCSALPPHPAGGCAPPCRLSLRFSSLPPDVHSMHGMATRGLAGLEPHTAAPVWKGALAAASCSSPVPPASSPFAVLIGCTVAALDIVHAALLTCLLLLVRPV